MRVSRIQQRKTEVTDLHGLPSHQTEAMPTWGWVSSISLVLTPAPYSMA